MTFKELLADEFDGKIALSDVIEDSAIDSLEYLQFIQRCEKEFNVALTDAIISKAITFHDLEHLFQFHHWQANADVRA
jgi:hypothetical protein